MRVHFIALALVGAGCADSLAEPQTPPPLAYPSPITYAMPANQGLAEDAPAKGLLVPSAHVVILDTPYVNRPNEIVGLVDVHEETGQREAALQALREKAAARGADAIVGLESHEAKKEGEGAHLSGLAVRFLPEAR